MSKKYVLNEEKPRQISPSIPELATRAGVPPQLAPVTEGSVAIALARVAAEATEEEATMAMMMAVTRAAAAALVVMVVTLAAATLGAVTRRGSRNTMLERTKPHGGLHFPPVTLVHLTRTRPSRAYLKVPLHPQRHQRNYLFKKSTCSGSRMMMLLVAGLPFLLRPTHLDPPYRSPPYLLLPLKVCFLL